MLQMKILTLKWHVVAHYFVQFTNLIYITKQLVLAGIHIVNSNREVAGSNLGHSVSHTTLGKLFTHVPLFTKQYKLASVHST